MVKKYRFAPKLNNSLTNISWKHVVRTLLYIFIFTVLLSCSSTLQQQSIVPNSPNPLSSAIDTRIDTSYVYDYHQTKYVPPSDKTLLILGQSLKNINEYRVLSKFDNYPAGWSAYWAVTEFDGFSRPWTTISGDTQYHGFLAEKFDNMVVHSAMWMVGKWGLARKVIEGTYDYNIKQYSAWAKSINKPIYLRIGYEFDGPHNEFEPEEYIAAYKHIVDLMRSEGVDNVAFVWHSYASKPYKDYPISAWYPGDDYVDWVAISVFFQPYNDVLNHQETNDVLNFAKEKKKPVMIAESNPVKGIEKGDKKVWNQWFVNFFTFCYQKNIKAIAFINEDWSRLKIPGIESWKDARLKSSDIVLKAWFNETNKDRYLKQSPELFDLLQFKRKN